MTSESERNEATARRWADTLWNRGDFSATPDLVTEGFICHGVSPERPTDEIRGRDGHDAWIRGARELLPDFHVEYDDLVAAGDRVAGRWTVRGTTAAGGERFTSAGIHLYRFEDGRIAEMWNEWHRVP